MNPKALLVLVCFGVLLLALPGAAGASSSNPVPLTLPVLQGKEPICMFAAQILNPTSGQPIVITIEPVTPCPGPPSEIKVLTPVQTTTCGSSELLTLEVVDDGGYNVKDGTTVALTTSLGLVPGTVSTRNGIASASFLAVGEESGPAEIIIYAGAVSTRKVIEVTCS